MDSIDYMIDVMEKHIEGRSIGTRRKSLVPGTSCVKVDYVLWDWTLHDYAVIPGVGDIYQQSGCSELTYVGVYDGKHVLTKYSSDVGTVFCKVSLNEVKAMKFINNALNGPKHEESVAQTKKHLKVMKYFQKYGVVLGKRKYHTEPPVLLNVDTVEWDWSRWDFSIPVIPQVGEIYTKSGLDVYLTSVEGEVVSILFADGSKLVPQELNLKEFVTQYKRKGV